MIEIIQQTSKTEENLENKLPKNIRQIGNPEKDFRIYMEDYVYTYLHPAQIPGVEVGILPRLLILLGEINHFSNRSCAFISGAIQVENSECREALPELNEATWRKVHQEMQRFFDKCEIVGWVLDIPGNALEISREMEEIHRINFVSKYQFFFLMDSQEREEAFYTWKEGSLRRKEGYFIYYEKNPQMQEYMISRREALYGEMPQPEEVPDQAAKNYRAMMMQKKEQSYKGKTGILSYLISILTVIALCTVSVILLGSIKRMDNMEQTISVMSIAMESTEGEGDAGKNSIAIETIGGNVEPLEKAAAQTRQEPEIAAADPLIQDPDALQNPGITQDSDDALSPDVSQESGDAQKESSDSNTDSAKEASSGTSASDFTEAAKYLEQGYYIVQPGDSLRQICYRIYQTHKMVEKICEVNEIENQDAIYVGQKIILPK